MRTPPISITVLGSLSFALRATALPEGEEPIGHIKRRFAAELKCAPGSADPNRSWCPVLRAQSEKLTLPSARTAYLGLSMSMLDGEPVLRQMAKTSELAVLCVGPSAGEAKLPRIRESGDERKRLLAPVRAQVMKFLQSESAGAIDLPPDLFSEIQGECQVTLATHGEDTQVDNSIAQNREGGSLFRVGTAYVVMQASSSTRTQVAVVSTAALRKR